MKVYVVMFGDMECSNLLAIFSTRKKAEEYLATYYELERRFGEDCVEFFYPDISEIEVDAVEIEEFQFYRQITKLDDGTYHNVIKRIDYRPFEEIVEFNKELSCRYTTATLEAEEATKEAIEYFKQKEKEE